MTTYNSSVALLKETIDGADLRSSEIHHFEIPKANGDTIVEWLRVCGTSNGEVHAKELTAVNVLCPTAVTSSSAYTLMVKTEGGTNLLGAASYDLTGVSANTEANPGIVSNGDELLDDGDYIKITVTAAGVITTGNSLFISLEFRDSSAP